MTTERYLGDGTPSAEDDRVRCWFCGHYTHNIQVAIWRQGERFWVDCRTCDKGLGHDPFILRRCSAFRVISPQYRIKLPPEAFERGWRERYGTEEYMLGTANVIEP